MYVAVLHQSQRTRSTATRARCGCLSGGAALPVEVLSGFEPGFGCIILEGYGLSETRPMASFNHADRGRKPGSIGSPSRASSSA